MFHVTLIERRLIKEIIRFVGRTFPVSSELFSHLDTLILFEVLKDIRGLALHIPSTNLWSSP